MTLKEKFENIIFNYIGSEWNRRDVSNSLETDAEDFAIGFAEWMRENEVYISISEVGDYAFDIGANSYTSKELLEIYKETL